jgi:hypothetical protein
MDAAPQTREAQPIRPRRRVLRYRLRTLLAGVALVAVGLALALAAIRGERQRRIVSAITAMGGRVWYDRYERDVSYGVPAEWPGKGRLLGVDYYCNVTRVSLPDWATDATVAAAGGLKSLEVLSLDNVPVTDAGLVDLRDLARLRELRLCDT